MLHLFDKVYLEFDSKLEVNFDRIVISKEYGKKMMIELDRIAYGELVSYHETYEDAINGNFVRFITDIYNFAKDTDKKCIIYCDEAAYKSFIAQWFRTILPNLDLESFKTLANYTVYNERIVSNTQLSSVHSTKLSGLWKIKDIESAYEYAHALNAPERKAFAKLDIKFSYEFLISSYLAGSSEKFAELKSTMHMFLRRWFKESLMDNRQMVLLNINNHRFQEALGIDPDLVDITLEDPLAPIEQLKWYADDEIWEKNTEFSKGVYGLCNLEGLSEEQIDGLRDTWIGIYDKFEGMQIDRSIFGIAKWLNAACRNELTDAEAIEILEYVVEQPFDTNLIPRFDFQNVNFTLLLHFLGQKYKGADLSKFILI